MIVGVSLYDRGSCLYNIKPLEVTVFFWCYINKTELKFEVDSSSAYFTCINLSPSTSSSPLIHFDWGNIINWMHSFVFRTK